VESPIEKVRATIAGYRMFDKGNKVVIGVSGGPDSVALLWILFSLKDEYKLSLYIAHLNHCLRGKEAQADVSFVNDLAKRLRLPFFTEEIDIKRKKLEIGHLSLETLARKERYDFLLRVAKRVGASKIALGHQTDDLVETILMHLIRGTGPRGLRGMPPVRKLSQEVILVRPLIRVASDEIKSYLEEREIPFRYDSSNLDLAHLRNRIRHELIPKLKEYNPKFCNLLIKSFNLLANDDEYLSSLAKKALMDLLLERSDQEIVLDLNKFIKEKPIEFRLIREALNMVKGDLDGITYDHIEAIARLIKKGPPQGRVDLPHEIKALREYDRLRLHIEKQGRGPIERKNSFNSLVDLPGKVEIPELNTIFETEILSIDDSFWNNLKEALNNSVVYFDYDQVKTPLALRFRQKGDRFSPLGMSGTKKVKDFFIDLKIPSFQRDEIPLLLDRKGIIWIVGYRIDERAKVRKETRRILKISYKKRGKE